jgi:tetratricopeptide (TPR) repeat protein
VQVLRQLLRRLDRSRRALVGARREQIREQAGAALVPLARHDARAALPALSRLALALPRQRPAAAAYAALAHVHYELGRYRRAIAVAREAQRLDPRSGWRRRCPRGPTLRSSPSSADRGGSPREVARASGRGGPRRDRG